ncbi:hypothetical protein RVIR1_03890 [Candidatus Rickettsiella viridis]|uniref:Uncharacterized protein n=2 Tax=Candidatus Rickettsiella viridis TaxID=676208 RepID=A0A2Z5UVC0_9COXI|nr:hypothetical protein RVIR1_03890 [Candidatus Rickettsiella viridis]
MLTNNRSKQLEILSTKLDACDLKQLEEDSPIIQNEQINDFMLNLKEPKGLVILLTAFSGRRGLQEKLILILDEKKLLTGLVKGHKGQIIELLEDPIIQEIVEKKTQGGVFRTRIFCDFLTSLRSSPYNRLIDNDSHASSLQTPSKGFM